MKDVGKALAIVLITGTVGCCIVAIVAIVNNNPMVAQVSGGGGLVLAIGAKAATGGKV